MNEMMAIETKDLTKSYGSIVAVDHLNLNIHQGELFALLGVNGAGKTTTIKMLTGLIRPTSGDAFLLGNSILSQLDTIKSFTNVSPQETAIAPNLSVYENLELIAQIYGLHGEELKSVTQQCIERLKLNTVYQQKAKTLSGGWQRRLSIAMALISRPKVIFLDEPTLGLDVLARRELWQLILDLKSHVTIVLTTHYMEEAEALSDRIGIMNQGCLKAVGSVDELKAMTNKPSLEEAFIALASR